MFFDFKKPAKFSQEGADNKYSRGDIDDAWLKRYGRKVSKKEGGDAKVSVSGKNGAAGVIAEKPFKVLQANPPLAKLIAKLKKNGMTLMMPVGPVDAPGTVKLTEETGAFCFTT
jgi:hypothetical protein